MGLPSVTEDAEGMEKGVQDDEQMTQDKAWRLAPVCFMWMILPIFLVLLASTASMHSVTADVKLIQNLKPEVSQLLATYADTKCNKDDDDHRNRVSGMSGAMGLSSPLSALLANDEASPVEEEEGGFWHFLNAPCRAVFGEPSFESRRASAAAEVERIITSRTANDILGGGSKAEQRQEFNRIARLLHPDKGLVATDDARAALALRLVFAARR